MERLKKASELCEPDRRNLTFAILDTKAPEGIRPPTAGDRHIEMAALELPPGLPEASISSFAVARNVWLYGWFHWPFYAVAQFLAYRCIEEALRQREAHEVKEGRLEASTSRRPLKMLCQIAVNTGWLTDVSFEHFRRMGARRRELESKYLAIGWLDEPTGPPAPNEYARILAENIPHFRNVHAHAGAPTVQLHMESRLILELARDAISQVLLPLKGKPE